MLLNGWHETMFPDRVNLQVAAKGGSVSQNQSGGADTSFSPGAQNSPCSIQPLSLEEVGRLMQVQIRATYKIVFPSNPGLTTRDQIDEVGNQARKFVSTGTLKFGDSADYQSAPGMAWTVYATLRA